MDIIDKHVARGRRTASRIWDKTAIVLLMPRGNAKIEENIFELNPAGAYFWKLLEEKPRVQEVIDHFAKEKGIEPDLAAKEVLKFIKKLAAEEMVDILD